MAAKTRMPLWVVFNILMAVASVYLVNGFLNYKEYTLSETNWQSDKIKLGRGLMQAWVAIFTKAMLHKNELNIGAWRGYQEVTYKDKVDARSVSFRYKNQNNPFCFIADRSDSFTRGIYFHYLNDNTCCLFIADSGGRFLTTKLFNLNPGHEDSIGWNNACVSRNGDSLTLSINRRLVCSLPFALPLLVQPGFRGPNATVLIDDVVAKNANGKIIFSESFSPPFNFRRQTLWAVGILMLLFFLLKLIRASATEISIINFLVFTAVAFSYWYYFNYTSGEYPVRRNQVNWHGIREPGPKEYDFCTRIDTCYPVEKLAGKRKVILFVGASQTWGMGATDGGKNMPALIEKQLRSHFNDSDIVTITCAIPGFSSYILYPHYINEWSKYKPALTIINLSTNDGNSDTFRVYLRKFLEFDSAQHIKTLLIAEPLDFHTQGQVANHLVMRQEGASFGVKVVEPQAYLDSCKWQGFLWWDFVHMTDYGYSLLAKSISPAIVESLDPYYNAGENGPQINAPALSDSLALSRETKAFIRNARLPIY